ncbi:hypothetical protein OESDEN_07406 [Oesophagostomum dentatum]|uniref:Uncharacterized protein n=1 Tax=Oesophagostomum dentatum TaxID=61180 RepID=A0A0B1TBJ0_OESDE|nr:hypothetical protein OESDEN_07406 [Oesophagostomum dentatum]
MDYSSEEYFQKCRYIHEVELVNMKLQMRILETHLETKDRLIRNLEDIIDEQETRIAHMEDFIQGDHDTSATARRRSSDPATKSAEQTPLSTQGPNVF